MPPETRTCPRCLKTLENAAFARDSSKASGFKSFCKACDNARLRRYYEENREARLAKMNARTAAARKQKGPRRCCRCNRLATSNRHYYCDRCRVLRKRHKGRQRELRRRRASAAERGYGTEHQRLRRQWKRLVEMGVVCCWRCGKQIAPGMPWDLGHDDHDRSIYRGPECRRCNRSTAKRRKATRKTSRIW
jgi:hypothetical protein